MKLRKNIYDSIKTATWFRFVAFLFLFAVCFIKPAEGQVVAVFENADDYLLTNGDQYRTVFMLEIAREKFEMLVSRALTMTETLTFESEKIKKNQYRCSILFIHPTDIYYVKKTLLNLGIEQLKINSNIYFLPDYEPANK